MGYSITVVRLILAQVVEVRILVPQPIRPVTNGHGFRVSIELPCMPVINQLALPHTISPGSSRHTPHVTARTADLQGHRGTPGALAQSTAPSLGTNRRIAPSMFESLYPSQSPRSNSYGGRVSIELPCVPFIDQLALLLPISRESSHRRLHSTARRADRPGHRGTPGARARSTAPSLGTDTRRTAP